MEKVLLMYPPGPLFQRGEDRCQQNIDDGSAQAMRACNDLGYAAAVLLRKNYNVKLRDYQTEFCSEADMFRELEEYQPDMVMISVTNTTIFDDIKISNRIKEKTNAVMVLKGAIFYDPEQAMLDLLDLSKVDYLIGGEVDFAIDLIADYEFHNKGNIEDVDNILYKDADGNIKRTPFHVWGQDLDGQPFPARQLMNNALYTRPDTDEPMATIQTSRGCPSNCIFCLSPEISGKKVRFRSPQNVMDEMTECYEKFGIRNFFFKADTFTINAQWVKELCTLIINSPLHNKIAFTANSRVRPLAKETLVLMKEAGCFTIAFGFESGSDDTLTKVHKGATVAENIQACAWSKEAGLTVWGFFVIGFPWETKEHIMETKKLIFQMKPDFIEITLALPFYGTPLYNMCKEDNLLAQSVLGSDFFHSSMKGTKYLSMEELLKLRRNILLQYYLRPSYIFKKMGECITHPKIFLNYCKYGIKLVVNLFK
ncbi:B12-binding domain-containing radical SAM protein [Lachnospiraceae bacterium ASD4241]|uniref:B12-binding domain-containing radical SAM protein n=2 Tax=Diplocloster modestus TaxID=2850322 RepID=A0ABS6K2N6_9FIRM|nr:B12-binding domain-containing radical SAM protein [Diplocloster modestus]